MERRVSRGEDTLDKTTPHDHRKSLSKKQPQPQPEKIPEKPEKIPEKPEKQDRRRTLKSEDEEDYDVSDDVSFSDDDVEAVSTDSGSASGERKKKSWSTRTKQGLGNSAVGKALFNKFVDKETKKLIHAVTVLVEKDKDKKTAKKLKADIFRIAVKVIVLHEEKYVSADDFTRLRGSFRRICSAMRNGYRTGVIDTDTASRISELIHNFASGIKDIIGKLVSSSTIERIDNLVNYLGATDFLVRTSKLKEFDTVAYVLAYYLQET